MPKISPNIIAFIEACADAKIDLNDPRINEDVLAAAYFEGLSPEDFKDGLYVNTELEEEPRKRSGGVDELEF